MRLIGTLENEHDALTFSRFLSQKEISHQLEAHTNTDWGSAAYGSTDWQLWVTYEDDVQDSLKWFHLFLENPSDPIFQTSNPSWAQSSPPLSASANPPPPPVSSSTSPWEKQTMGWITRSLLAICCMLFLLSQLLIPQLQIPQRYAGLVLFTSPIEKFLLYDYPKFYQLIDRFLYLYGYEELEKPLDLPAEGQQLLQQINHTPFWPGFYQLVLKGGLKEIPKSFTQYPTFEKIREGQIWRLFSPCLLHGDLFHLFFNMLWLIVLGKQIEQRLTPWRYLVFILVIGMISNTAQYLMSGPNFIGFSGILCGMLAFIWTRQKIAAWEGYQMDRLTLIFMLIFIISMAGIQFLSFFLEKSFEWAISPNIANMAHLVGGLLGFLLGRLHFFSWRHG